MTLLWAIALFSTTLAGTYLLLSRDLFRILMGLSILGAAVNILLLGSGRFDSTRAPFVPEGATTPDGIANPLPQALVLTAIVIGFSMTCFSLILLLRWLQSGGSDDAEALRGTEPAFGPDQTPVTGADEQDIARLAGGAAQ